jgi:Spy/CpxP family protein refolding chaperone
MLKTLFCVIVLTASTALFAQPTPRSDSGKAPRAERRFDCSKAKDPKACEERVAKAKAAREQARQSCQGKKGDEERECMRREMCAQTKDPAKCEAHIKERGAQRAQVREACKDKKGEELRSCVREHRQKK